MDRYAILEAPSGWEVVDVETKIPAVRLQAPLQNLTTMVYAAGTKAECERFIQEVRDRLELTLERYDPSWRTIVWCYKNALAAWDRRYKAAWLEVARVIELELNARDKVA